MKNGRNTAGSSWNSGFVPRYSHLLIPDPAFQSVLEAFGILSTTSQQMQKKKEKKETQSCMSVTWSKASSTDVVCHQLVYQCVIRVKLCGYVTYTQKAGTQRGRDTGKHTLGHLPSLCRNAGTERKMLLIRENIPGVSVVEANDANARLSSTRRVQWRRRRRQQCKQCMWSDFMCSVQREALRSRFCFVFVFIFTRVSAPHLFDIQSQKVL